VTFEVGNCSFWAESHSHLSGEHAEVKALKNIITEEEDLNTVAR